MRLINLPKPGTDVTVVPKDFAAVSGGYFTVLDGQWRCGEISGASVSGVAADIADAINQARDLGFQMGLSSIRDALGIRL